MPILGAAQIGDAVATPVHYGGTYVVPLDALRIDGAQVLEEPLAVAGVNLAQKIRVPRVHQQIEATVAVPIDRAEFAASVLPAMPEFSRNGLPCSSQKARAAVARPPTDRCTGTLIKGQITLMVQHYRCRQPVVVPVHSDRRGPPLRQ